MKRKKFVNKTEYYLFRVALWKLRLFPYRISSKILAGLFVRVGLGLGIRKKVTEANLRLVYPDMEDLQRNQLLRNIYYNMGLTAAETYLMKEDQLLAQTSFRGRNHIEAAHTFNRGVILVTAHLGNWELARLFPQYAIPLSVVVKKQHNPYFDHYNNRVRTQHGLVLIDFRRGLRDILGHLHKNEMVAILADQNAGSSGLMLDFMGHPAAHWKGVAKLSLRYKIPLVPGFVVRKPDGTLVFSIEPMIYHPELEDDEDNYAFLLKKVNQVIETYIDRYPEQWLWLHRRWKKPDDEHSAKPEDVLD